MIILPKTMTEVYKSELLTRLFNEQDEDEILLILAEIDDLKDSIFIHPLYDKYKKYRSSSISHYFISSLSEIDSPEVLDVAKDIFFDPKIKESNLPWTIGVFTKNKLLDNSAKSKLIKYLKKRKDSKRLSYYELEDILNYLKLFKRDKSVSKILRNIVENKSLGRITRNVALSYLIENNPKEEYIYFSIIFPRKLDDMVFQVMLAKAASQMKSPYEGPLRNSIKRYGSGRSKEIIADSTFNKMQNDVVDTRYKLNYLRSTKLASYINLFPRNQLLRKHTSAARSRSEFVAWCMDFRDFIQDTSRMTKNHGYNEAQIKRLLPDESKVNYNKSLNRLFLFLKSNDVEINADIFGLRKLNRLVSLIAHPREKNDRDKVLKKIGLYKKYYEKQWGKIQLHLLRRYKRFLNKINKHVSN